MSENYSFFFSILFEPNDPNDPAEHITYKELHTRVCKFANVLKQRGVKKGDRVTMNLDYLPGTTWDGNVDYIYPTLDIKTRTIRLRLKFDNAEKKLLPNMFAQVVIHSESNENLLLIPREALIQTGSQDRVVLALGEGSFKSIEVTTGREDQENVEILVGLDEGDKVVSEKSQ